MAFSDKYIYDMNPPKIPLYVVVGSEETRGQFCAAVNKGSGIFRH